MYNFSITNVDTDYSNKKITINFNQHIDSTSVNDKNIFIINKKNRDYIKIDYKVKNKQVDIIFKDWPIPNNEYILFVQSIKNVLDDVLLSPLKRTIIFNSNITSKINILSPINNSMNKDCEIVWEEEAPLNKFINKYYIEISTDPAFYRIEEKTTVIKNNVLKVDLQEGQYYIRIRAQDNIEYGEWSETTTFKISTNEEKNIDEILLPEIEDTLVLSSTPIDGETPIEFVFEFDNDIEYKSIKDVFVLRRDV